VIAAVVVTIALIAVAASVFELKEARTAPADRPGTGLILYGVWNSHRQEATWFTVRPDGTHNQSLRITSTCAIWWPDGSKILITNDAAAHGGQPLRPATIDPDGSNLRPLDATHDRTLNLGCGQVSPDRRTIALEGFNDHQHGENGIYTVRAGDGGDLVRLTHSPPGGADGNPRFAPDGRRIVFLRTMPGVSPEGAGALFTTTTTGSETRRITPWGFAFLGYGWSPDGQWIVFQRPYGQLYLVHPDGTGLHRIPLPVPPGTGAQNPSWSPDGSKIVFSLEHDGHAGIYTVDVDGSHLRQVTGADNADEQMPDWGPG
jgi:Tol biopolymer transport system component